MRKLKCEICLIESKISHYHKDNPVLKCGHSYTTTVLDQINEETSNLITQKMESGLNMNEAMDEIITELIFVENKNNV